MNISDITLYNVLIEKIGRHEAKLLVEFLKSETKKEMETLSMIFLTKQDKVELIEKINTTKTELVDKINTNNTGLIRWMIALWLSAAALIISILKFL